MCKAEPRSLNAFHGQVGTLPVHSTIGSPNFSHLYHQRLLVHVSLGLSLSNSLEKLSRTRAPSSYFHRAAMADPISASAAILGILSAAPKIIQLFTSIISATKEASQGLQDAREEVKHVEISMRSLERHLSSLESIDPSRAAYIEVDHLIVMLTDMTLTFEGLEKLLDTLAPTKPLGVVRNTVAWSRHAKDINRYIEKLQRNKSSLSLMLNIIQR